MCLEIKHHEKGIRTMAAFYIKVAAHYLQLRHSNEAYLIQEERQRDCDIVWGIVKVHRSRGQGGNEVGSQTNANQTNQANTKDS